jgi:signal transduction histidine kinase
MTSIGRPLNVVLLLLFLGCSLAWGHSAAAQKVLGQDIAFQWYEDASGSMTVDQLLALPDDALGTSHRVLSLGYTRSALWVRFFAPVDGEARWLEIGPNYLDNVTVFYRPVGGQGQAEPPFHWTVRHAGDLWPQTRGDIDYRFPVFVLPALIDANPPAHLPQSGSNNLNGASGLTGYEVLVRVQSTSAVLLQASLWSPNAFVQEAIRSTAFWSFYFGLAALSSILALIAAIYLRHRLAWALCAFSLSYGLVACIQGFVSWVLKPNFALVQHYLTGILTLLAYTSLLWLTTEALNLRVRHPRLNRLMWVAIGFNLFLQLSIPFDFYGLAIQTQGIVFILTSLVLAVSAWSIWRDAQNSIMTLMVGLMPMMYVISGLLALASLFGWIPYYEAIYGIWQYVILVNMLTALVWVALVVRQEARDAQSRVSLKQQLDMEREASFHQRQFLGMVAHEFRNPLAVISSALENLQLKSISDVQRRHRYRNMRLATNRLVQLTDNCLADSRLSFDGLVLERERLNILDVVRAAAEVVDRSEHHRRRLLVNGKAGEANPQIKVPVMGDRAMLRIAFSNLFDNAVKYSKQGPVEIDVTVGKNGFVGISIRDRGKGIAPADTQIIFERYRRHATPPY